MTALAGTQAAPVRDGKLRLTGDYDNDGDSDLYVACLGANRLCTGTRETDGSRTSRQPDAGVGDSTWSVCAVWLDYDRDGDLDLFVGNYLRVDRGTG